MEGTSAGQINLDLVLNQGGFNRQLRGITSIAKKAGAALAAAFAVKKLIDFGKECIELGSDLAEVQNVVDVVFPSMTAQVDKFAKSAAEAFGLSETMAKKYTGTFGAMAKAFGFSEAQAYGMSTALTGLAGDVASFYNITQDEAYTKLKSVFTGETETLKDLGIVMTQNALDAYALANGYGTVTAKMSEAEKVALRYNFVQSQLTAASGDFARTSDSWTNQVRILTLQFDTLKATIGQGLINIFLPIIKVINAVIGKLISAANAFKAFTELITGKKSGASQIAGAGQVAEESLSGAAGAADNLAGATTGAGNAAKKAAKEMKALMGFDQINKLNEKDDSGSGGGSGGAGGGGFDFGNLSEGETVLDKTEKSASKLVERMKELAGHFKEGYDIGFKTKSLETFKENLHVIQQKMKEVWENKELAQARTDFENQFAETMGTCIGSAHSIGISVGTGVSGGIRKAFENENFTHSLTTNLTGVYENFTDITKSVGDLAEAFATIGTAFESESFQDIVKFFTELGGSFFTDWGDKASGVASDFINLFVKPISDNADKIKTVFEGIFDVISTILEPLQGVLDMLMSSDKKYNDGDVHGFFREAAEFLSGRFSEALENMKKGLEKIHLWIKKAQISAGLFGAKLKEVFSDFPGWVKKKVAEVWLNLQSGLSAIREFFGGIWESIKGFFAGIPDWFREKFEGAWTGIQEAFSGVGEFFGGIWNNIVEFFAGVPEWFHEKFGGAWDKVSEAFSGAGEYFSGKWDNIKEFFADVPGWFQDKFEGAYTYVKESFAGVGEYFSGKWDKVKQFLSDVPGWFQEKFEGGYNNVQNAFAGIGEYFSGKWDKVKEFFADVPDWFHEKFEGAYNKIKEAFSGIGTYFSGLWDDIKQCFSDVGTNIGNAVSGAFKSVLNGAMSTIEKTINNGISFINSAIGFINNIPGVKIGKIGNVSLPRLAQGGYVEKNTPQLAMIGDNRHQGEVVAPEDKLRQMAAEAVQMAGGGGGFSTEILKVLKEILQILKELDLDIVIDGKKLKDVIVTKINQNTAATGICEILT